MAPKKRATPKKKPTPSSSSAGVTKKRARPKKKATPSPAAAGSSAGSAKKRGSKKTPPPVRSSEEPPKQPNTSSAGASARKRGRNKRPPPPTRSSEDPPKHTTPSAASSSADLPKRVTRSVVKAENIKLTAGLVSDHAVRHGHAEEARARKGKAPAKPASPKNRTVIIMFWEDDGLFEKKALELLELLKNNLPGVDVMMNPEKAGEQFEIQDAVGKTIFSLKLAEVVGAVERHFA